MDPYARPPLSVLPLAALLALCIYRAEVQLTGRGPAARSIPVTEPVPAPPSLPAASARPKPRGPTC